MVYVIRMDPRNIVWGGVGWMQLAQDRVQWQSLRSTVMNLFVLSVLIYRGSVGILKIG
jgi:hypothetical protein